jgi:YbbR domain-containing protein
MPTARSDEGSGDERSVARDRLRRLRRNAGLRAISVLIAIGLWMFVNAGQRGAVEPLQIPISYRSLPAGLVIINRPPDFVKIEVAGPRTLLSLLDPERLTVRLDLKGVAPGQSDFKINAAMFNVPRQTTVTRISPDDVSLDIDRVVSREVPVHLNIEGQVASGYQINSVEVKPATVAVSGASRYVMPLLRTETEPFDVRGVTADVQRAVEVVPPTGPIRLSAMKVEAKVDVGEVIADKEFRGVEVQVRDTDYKVRIDPSKASITLRGPAIKLASLDPTGMVYVDAKGGTPGSHDLPLQVELPDGMQLVRQSPSKVRLRIYREKRITSSDGHTS